MNYRALLALSIALVCTVANHDTVAAGGTALEPNYFRLSDTLGGVSIVLDNHLPTPTLSYRVGGKTQLFSGSSMTVEDSAIGKLVTVTTKFMPDLDVLTLSFLIPNMKIPAGSPSLPFSSVAILTDHLTSFTGPPVSGVTEVYSAPVILTGIAKAVP